MAGKGEDDLSRLDDAARAGWLYYVAGNTQEVIARKLGVSRQSAQRLVSLAVSEKLVKVRLDHPISRCMELAECLIERFGLVDCDVVPSDPEAPGSVAGIALSGSAKIERHLNSKHPKVIAMGTGRALRACVEQVRPMDCPQHRVVSLLGNMMSDGSATLYNVVVRLAERVKARHFPMPLPVLARSPEDRRLLHRLEPAHNILELARRADVTFVGIGGIGYDAPLAVDGFLSREDVRAVIKTGGVGEITSWIYDQDGKLIEGMLNDRVASSPLVIEPEKPVIALAVGEAKVPAILGAMRGRLINALVTNEATAEMLLDA